MDWLYWDVAGPMTLVPAAPPLILIKLTCLPLVEVVQDFTAEVLLPLPLALTRVVEEVPQGPVLPLQQLPVQQQGECRLCGPEHGSTESPQSIRIIHCEVQLRMLTSSLVTSCGYSGRADGLWHASQRRTQAARRGTSLLVHRRTEVWGPSGSATQSCYNIYILFLIFLVLVQ